MEKLYIASDHGGFRLKNEIREHLKLLDIEIEDLGCYTTESCDYPDFAHKLVYKILEDGGRGILVCGTGIGMSIAANRHAGIRASLCTDTFSARMTRLHNNSNVLCLGGRITGTGLAMEIVDTWLKTEFEGGRHLRRIEKI